MTEQDQEPQADRDRGGDPGMVAGFFGFIFIVAGILIVTTSGLCTLYVLVQSGGDLSVIGTVLFVGGVSIVAGYGIYKLGRGLLRGMGRGSRGQNT